MKILLINKFLYPKGGAETYVQDLANGLKEAGHEVQFFGTKDKRNTMTNEYGIYSRPADFHTKNILEAMSYPFRIIYSVEARDKLKKLIKLYQPDIIHINNFNFHLTPSILDAIPNGIPVVFTAHDAQLICPNHLMYISSSETTCQACFYPHGTGACIKNRCTHNSLPKSIISASEGWLYRASLKYDRFDAILCPSRFIQDVYEHDPRFHRRTLLMPNPVSKRETVAKKPDINDKHKDYVFYFGRISPEKGVKNIVESARQLPDIPFVIAGGDDVTGLLKNMPKNMEFVGFKTGKDLDTLIQDAKLVILPSICYENCPLAVIEAQQLGAAVLVPGYGGTAEMTIGPQLRDGRAETLTNAIRKLCGNEKVLYEMRADSFERTQKYPSLQEHVSEIVSYYERLRKDYSPWLRI